MKPYARAAILAGFLFAARILQAAEVSTELFAIQDISDGQTITFSEAGGLPAIESQFDLQFTGTFFETTFRNDITGNVAAPASGHIIELKVPGTENPSSVRIESTGKPWNAIGASFGASSLLASPTLRLTAFDVNGALIRELSRTFDDPTHSVPGFNAAVFFLGISSDIPIKAIQFQAIDTPGGIDNLTFRSVPEPTAIALSCMSFVAVVQFHRRRQWIRVDSISHLDLFK